MNKLIAVIRPDDGELWGALAKVERPGKLRSVAFDRVHTDAFTKSYVTDSDKAVKAVKELTGRLLGKAQGRIAHLWCAIASNSVEAVPSRGSLVLSKYARCVSPSDLSRSFKLASTLRLPLDKIVLHKIITGYSIDGSDKVREPIGMEAVKLETAVNIVTVNRSIAENLRKCVEESGLFLDGFIYTLLADQFVLAPDKLREGDILMADISAEVAHLGSFASGRLSGLSSLAVGTRQICAGEALVLEKADKIIQAIDHMVKEYASDKIVISGELSTSEEFLERLEEKTGNSPISAVFHAPSASHGEGRSTVCRKMTGMLRYLELNEFRSPPRTGWLHFARSVAEDFISRYF